ncbi:hypothetical protein GCM10027058_15420 [Microbacterium neimengense]
MMRKKMMAAILGSTVLACTVGLSGTAVAAETTVDDEQYSWYVENGVQPDVAQDLIEKFNSGVLPDSMTGTEPVSSTTSAEAGWIVTRDTFADGSISISKLETPQATESSDDFTTKSVGSCSSSIGGSGFANYYDCAVTGSNGVYLDVEFRADYTRVSNGAGIINAVRSPYAYAIGGQATTPVLRIDRSNGTMSDPARATATSQYSSTATSFTAVVTLKVNGQQAWSEQNFS